MTKKLFRFFTEIEHAENFLSGQILFRNLAHFQRIEDDLARADLYEGVLQHRTHSGGTIINNITQEHSTFLSGFDFNASVDPNEVFILCLSETLTEKICREFKAKAAVEVHHKKKFINKIKEAISGASFHASKINYAQNIASVKTDWYFPNKVAFRKKRDFGWQHEYRIAYSRTGAMSDGKTTLTISHESAPKHTHQINGRTEILECGSLKESCKMFLL